MAGRFQWYGVKTIYRSGRLIGNRKSDRDVLCDNFGDIAFVGPAKGVTLSGEEAAFVARIRAGARPSER